ncbi:alpha-1,2-fucosyltransferase [Butyrivibrio sp. TB]|uniref:alpha-1,2-fucosyltransferase n=1 Tax=Butyrivibrio sp. TB TaxID=1520809 RepID=UPI0008B841C9|nr:alpha-1,2-fucosyltransferase [Butyrivibrio sp. TB]SEQ35969.1 Glycosyl transferase family 11 [Butyrivibrio sp. TB]
MIGTEFSYGSGLGNQLFWYVCARAAAENKGCEFGIINPKGLANNMHSDTGMYFMDIDLGIEIPEADKSKFTIFEDEDHRLYLGNSSHDMEHGVYVSGVDKAFFDIEDNTLLYGNLQGEEYFEKYKDRLKDWLKVKPEYDSHEYTKDNLCIIHLRCGDYSNSPELWLDRKYWLHGIKNMKKVRPDMEFLAVTDDMDAAHKILPEVKAVTNDLAKDYVTIKNAKYLLLSNSSFAVFPAFTSDELVYAIAPKYWARHNVSDGYWASEQNIYSCFHYMDKRGKVFSADECRKELEEYKKASPVYRRLDQKPGSVLGFGQNIRAKALYFAYMSRKAYRSIVRRMGIIG